MKISQFVGVTTWSSLLIITFSLLFGVIDSNGVTWFLFGFLCVVGVLNFLFSVAENRKEK